MGDGVLFRLGIAVGDVFQRQGVVPLRQLLSAAEAEGLRPVQKLPQDGDVQALPVELCELVQKSRHPLGKAADRAKIEKKAGNAQFPFRRQGDEIDIGRAVAQQRQRQVDDVGPEVGLLPLGDPGPVEPQGVLPELHDPVPQAQDADILGVLPLRGRLIGVAHAVLLFLPLLAVAVAPLQDTLAGEVTSRCRDGDQRNDPRIQSREKGQIHGKAHEICQNLRPGGPDPLRGGIVALQRLPGLLLRLNEGRVQEVGVAGLRDLPGPLPQQLTAHADAGKDGVLVQIGVQRREAQQHRRKTADGPQQGSKALSPLDLSQDHGGQQQLRHGLARRRSRHGKAEKRYAPKGPPCRFQHKGAVLPEVIFGFSLGFLHGITSFAFLLPSIAQKFVPGPVRGRIVKFRG